MNWDKAWLEGEAVDSAQLEALLKAREEGEADFLLVDVREPWEYEMGHIPGVDLLRPTTAFRGWARDLVEAMKDRPIILTCRTANRTGMLQPLLQRMGHPRVINHLGGIVAWHGPVEEGGYTE
jgi:rhodanese-related sulfurtransferase